MKGKFIMLNSLTGRCIFHAIVLNLLLTSIAGAQQDSGTSSHVSRSPWSMTIRSGYAHQFDADLDGAGSFTASSLFIQGGPVYQPDHNRSISLSVGYGYDNYDFSGYGSNRATPWQEIHSLGFSSPVRLGYGERWSFIAVPAVRFTAEKTSDWDDGVTGGGFAGFSYRFSDRLTIGSGIGLFSQLEDDASVFPILIISWKMTDRLSLETGSGHGTAQGPGLTMNWNPTGQWKLFLGGRYEKERFRLSSDGPSPGGIGEDSSFPLYVGATYSFTEKIRIDIVGGVKISGQLRQEDQQGSLVSEHDYDPAPFLGLTFRGRF